MEYQFPPEFDEHLHKIITLKPVDPVLFATISYTQSKELTEKHEAELQRILAEEYPESSVGVLYCTKGHPHRVVIFEDEDDTLSFALKYGHVYGTKP